MFSVVKKMLSLRGGRGMDFGVERTRRLLDYLGAPDCRLKIIHIAGSNGKGAISQYISHILCAAGKKTGSFSTPEIYSYFDQYEIDCKTAEIAPWLKKAYKAGKALSATEFEISFCAAMLAFADAGCEYAVVECGLGGRTDATNAVLKKRVAIISSVSLEHTAILGSTVPEICAQKQGIANGCPEVVSALQTSEGRAYFSRFSPVFAGDGIQILSSGLDGQSFVYKGETYRLCAAGDVQPYNAACAIEAAEILNIDGESIKAGLFAARLKGRIEVIKKDRVYILDGGHNPAAVKPLVNLLKGCGADIVYGCLSDKDIDGVVSQLAPIARNIYAVQPPSARAMDGEKIYSACLKYNKNTYREKSVRAALGKSRGKVCAVCGSFTLLKEAKKWIEKR